MKRLLSHIIILTVCVLLILYLSNSAITGILGGIISGIVVIYVDEVAGKFENLKYWLIAIRFRNKYIRLSISYLFRIKVKNKYLLIQGKRFSQFQPVGGVYKRLLGSTSFFRDIQALDDHLVPIDQISQNDLRIRIKGKHLISFLKWFNSGKDRELSPWREFYEELIKTGYFPENLFPYIFYRYISRYEHPLRFSKFADSYELLITDIYELVPSQEQTAFLERMIATNNNPKELVWVDEERIRRLGAIPGESYTLNISEHSSWII